MSVRFGKVGWAGSEEMPKGRCTALSAVAVWDVLGPHSPGNTTTTMLPADCEGMAAATVIGRGLAMRS